MSNQYIPQMMGCIWCGKEFEYATGNDVDNADGVFCTHDCAMASMLSDNPDLKADAVKLYQALEVISGMDKRILSIIGDTFSETLIVRDVHGNSAVRSSLEEFQQLCGDFMEMIGLPDDVPKWVQK